MTQAPPYLFATPTPSTCVRTKTSCARDPNSILVFFHSPSYLTCPSLSFCPSLSTLEDELDVLFQERRSRKKPLKAVREFRGYIEANQNFIPRYGDRYRHGGKDFNGLRGVCAEAESSGEQAKKQEMRWSEAGAHNLLQVRPKALDDQLRETFVHPHWSV